MGRPAYSVVTRLAPIAAGPSALELDDWRVWCGHGQVGDGGLFVGAEAAKGALEINCLHALEGVLPDRLSTRVIKGVSYTDLEGAKVPRDRHEIGTRRMRLQAGDRDAPHAAAGWRHTDAAAASSSSHGCATRDRTTAPMHRGRRILSPPVWLSGATSGCAWATLAGRPVSCRWRHATHYYAYLSSCSSNTRHLDGLQMEVPPRVSI